MKVKYEVLDIGSGHNPYEKADVLCERYLEDVERTGHVKIDARPFVIGTLEFLPFKDKSFDLVTCSHVLEHVDNPHRALEEIKRVGKSAYIVTPSWIAENYMYRRRYHKSVVMSSFGKVYVIHNKYFSRQLARSGEKQAPEQTATIKTNFKRLLDMFGDGQGEGVEKIAGCLNSVTRILTTVMSINSGAKRVLLTGRPGFWNKIYGLWFLIIGGVVQQIRDTFLYLYYQKKQEKTLQVWKLR
ncbi:MAG: Ubiquinone/menaquinone biosynthesis C-methyltransferase UbiE [Candidatus Methanophagaceae archaeon]|nr:MAG: Ubiquinone/menaquinone biosynthesis C-methyltransferase UbiE [Methanophagales archaeon]KAF5432927.1 Ubiquinone/menaquinone biosynthesis C-methylase UbiE [Methanophagales archaeon]